MDVFLLAAGLGTRLKPFTDLYPNAWLRLKKFLFYAFGLKNCSHLTLLIEYSLIYIIKEMRYTLC